jgi:hypothetical protein
MPRITKKQQEWFSTIVELSGFLPQKLKKYHFYEFLVKKGHFLSFLIQ